MRATQVISLIQTKIRKLDNRASEDGHLPYLHRDKTHGEGVWGWERKLAHFTKETEKSKSSHLQEP